MDKCVGNSIYSTSVAGMMMMMIIIIIITITITMISSGLHARFVELLTGFRACEVIRTLSFFFGTELCCVHWVLWLLASEILSFPIVFSNQWHSIWLPLWLPSCYFRSPSSGGDSYEIASPAPPVVVFRVMSEESIREANCDWFSSCMNNQYFTVVRPLLAQDVYHSCKINISQRFVKWFQFFLVTQM